MKYSTVPVPLLVCAGVSAFFGYPMFAAGALVAAGLFAVADSLQRKT